MTFDKIREIREAALIGATNLTKGWSGDFHMSEGYMCSGVFIRVYLCVCHTRGRAKRPLPCTQIITWFYNVAYLYSGQFPLGTGGGGVWNNNAGHFTPPSRRTFSALILSMDLTSFPR